MIEHSRRPLANPLRDALALSPDLLGDVHTNFFRFSPAFEYPRIKWGRDFEVRVLLEAKSKFSCRNFESALPARFDEHRSWWGSYVRNLSEEFCRAFHTRGCLVRFSQISSDLCSLFNCDNVQVRLIQTFQGPGTEFLLDANVARCGLGKGCNEKIVIDAGSIQRAKEKEILLMRGERWFPERALVHRSPPIQKQGLKRLYLCLDTIDPIGDITHAPFS